MTRRRRSRTMALLLAVSLPAVALGAVPAGAGAAAPTAGHSATTEVRTPLAGWESARFGPDPTHSAYPGHTYPGPAYPGPTYQGPTYPRSTDARVRTALTPCPGVAARARCGHLDRAWDPADPSAGTVRIGFAVVPATDPAGPVDGTVLAQEGGPGYSTTGSAASYVRMLGPLLRTRDLVLVDQRGTGRSEPVDCPALQRGTGSFSRAARECGRLLGPRAHLLGTARAVDDTAAVLASLGVREVDFYGDSYGTFFGQVLAARHPDLLRTIVLDGAYPVTGEDAWYPTQGPALRQSLEVVCARSASCPAGSPVDRLDRLLERLRQDGPLRGWAPGADGRRHRVSLDPAALVTIAYNATYVPTTYAELDAAVRAALGGIETPLLRLLAEVEHPGRGGERWYSAGAELAVSCHDYPQLFDLQAAPAVRWRQYEAAVREQRRVDPDLYAPFTLDEYLDSGWGGQDWCWNWPVAPARLAPGPPVPPDAGYPPVPTLVLSGELDTITTPAEGRMVAERFPAGTQVVVANSLHVTAMDDPQGCAQGLVRQFVASGGLADSSCAAAIPPIRTAGPFVRSWRDGAPAVATSGPPPGTARLRAVTAAVGVAGDAIDRWWQAEGSSGLGLYAGTWSASGGYQVRIRLSGYELAPGLAVSGTVGWDRRTDTVESMLRVRGPAAVSGHLVATWSPSDPAATVTGVLGGRTVSARA